jgi:NitT/TauT family transport system substrate-binding protein
MKLSTGLMRRTGALLLIGVLLVACGATPPAGPTGGTGATPAAGAAKTTLRTGYIPLAIYAPLYVAIERGYFASEGIEIALTPIVSGNDALVQLASGNFDVALGGANAGLFNAASRGVKFSIVAPLHLEKPPLTTPLMISAKRADEIKTVADLKGKKVSVNALGAATEYWLAQALAKGGLTMNDVEVKGVPFADVPAALESGSLDAAMLTEPGATINVQKGVLKILANDFIDGFAATYVYMGDALLTGKPELAAGFMRAYLHACRDLQGPFDDTVATIVEKYTKVPAAVVKAASRPYYDPNGTISVDNLNSLQEYFMQRGELSYKTALDVKTFVNTTLAADAVKALDKK